MSEKEAPLHIDAVLDLADDHSSCIMEVSSSDGLPLTPQVILDAVADMLMTRFAMDTEEWLVHDEDLNS